MIHTCTRTTCVLDMCTSLFVYQVHVAGSGRGPPVFVLRKERKWGKKFMWFFKQTKKQVSYYKFHFFITHNTNNVHNARHCIDEGLRCSEQ